MKKKMWKLQFVDAMGIADVKESVDGNHYKVCTYATRKAAEASAKELRKLDHIVNVVPLTAPSTWDLY